MILQEISHMTQSLPNQTGCVNVNNLVQFFRAVLDRRDSLEEEKENSVFDTLGASSVPGLPGIRTRRHGDHRLRAD